MYRFIKRLLLYFILFVTLFIIFILKGDSYIDFFYKKFSSPKYASLVLGDSRSFQGIVPEMFSEVENAKLYNYSFTIAQVSYDSIYFESVLKKIKPDSKNGLFIFSIHPWVLSEPINDIDKIQRIESRKNQVPNDMNLVNINPNFEYIYKHLSDFNFKGVIRRNSILHDTGWLENKVLPKTEFEYNNNVNVQYNMYKEFSQKWKPSKGYLKILKKYIEVLDNKGKVVLVRMPVCKEISTLEQQYWSNFNDDVKEIIDTTQVLFIDYSDLNSKFSTYDGNHLNKEGAINFSKHLSKEISKFNN